MAFYFWPGFSSEDYWNVSTGKNVNPKGWFRLALSIVILATTVGWAAPKPDPSWSQSNYFTRLSAWQLVE